MTSFPIGSAEQQARIDAVVEAAAVWCDPEHLARISAVEQTLEAPNRFTEPAIAFAINQQMDLVTPEALAAWLDGHGDEIQLIAARSGVDERLSTAIPVVPPGTAQRPPLDWQPDRIDTVDFLTALG